MSSRGDFKEEGVGVGQEPRFLLEFDAYPIQVSFFKTVGSSGGHEYGFHFFGGLALEYSLVEIPNIHSKGPM